MAFNVDDHFLSIPITNSPNTNSYVTITVLTFLSLVVLIYQASRAPILQHNSPQHHPRQALHQFHLVCISSSVSAFCFAFLQSTIITCQHLSTLVNTFQHFSILFNTFQYFSNLQYDIQSTSNKNQSQSPITNTDTMCIRVIEVYAVCGCIYHVHSVDACSAVGQHAVTDKTVHVGYLCGKHSG